MMKPLVSIVTVNFNQKQLTLDLLHSLLKSSYKNFEILVVDNGSHKDPITVNELPKSERIRLISSDINLGFAGGNNLAIKEAKGEFIMLLNNDTEVDEGFLEPLVSQMLADMQTAICSSKLLFYNSGKTIQYAGSTPLSKITLQSNSIGYGEKDEGQHDRVQITGLAHGAAMLVRKSTIDKVGLIPTPYFLYYEEVDWCIQIQKQGLNIVFVPQSIVFHKESQSIGKLSPLQVYYKTRNRILLSRRQNKGFAKLISLAYLALVWLRDYFKYTFKKMPLHKEVLVSAMMWHFTNRVVS